MPRNVDVQVICDELIRVLTTIAKVEVIAATEKPEVAIVTATEARKGHARYMRDYMRLWRGGKVGSKAKK